MPLGYLLPGIFSACLYFRVSFEVTSGYENRINMPSTEHHPVIQWSHVRPSFKTVLMTEQMDDSCHDGTDGWRDRWMKWCFTSRRPLLYVISSPVATLQWKVHHSSHAASDRTGGSFQWNFLWPFCKKKFERGTFCQNSLWFFFKNHQKGRTLLFAKNCHNCLQHERMLNIFLL